MSQEAGSHALRRGVSVRAVGRFVSVNHQTVANRVADAYVLSKETRDSWAGSDPLISKAVARRILLL